MEGLVQASFGFGTHYGSRTGFRKCTPVHKSRSQPGELDIAWKRPYSLAHSHRVLFVGPLFDGPSRLLQPTNGFGSLERLKVILFERTPRGLDG